MNTTRFLRSAAAALVVASVALPAIAGSPGEHPAVLVSQSWSQRGIDPNTFIVRHPAGPQWVDATSTAKEIAPQVAAARAVKTASASKP